MPMDNQPSTAQRLGSLLKLATTKILPLLIGTVVLILIIAWFAGFFEDKIEPTAEIQSSVEKVGDRPTDLVHEVTKDYVEEAVGTLKAASRTSVSARVLAAINAINVSAGDQVERGDVLVELDDEQLQAQLKQAEQAYAVATATRREAETNFARFEQLVKQKAASPAEYEQSSRQLEVAQANVLRTEQAVNEARVLLSYATIVAPKAGRVVDRLAEPGDTAQPGQPILVLYDASSLRLEAPVLEHLAVKLQPGQVLQVYIDALDRSIAATIDEIVPQADAPSRSFLVKASLPRSDDLYEGMFGRLRIPAGSRRHLCLATDAISEVGQLQFVQVVQADGSLEKRFVKTGRLGMPGRVEVLSGLQAGEQVLLHDQEYVTDADAVQSSEVNQEGAPQ